MLHTLHTVLTTLVFAVPLSFGGGFWVHYKYGATLAGDVQKVRTDIRL